MDNIEETQDAINYLDSHWPKGCAQRGEAMVLLGLSILAGREEMEIIIKNNKK